MALYKEVVERRTNSIILSSLCTLLFFIVIFDFFEAVSHRIAFYSILRYLLYITMGILFVLQRRRIKTKFKYTIIQDELMIHKIIGSDESLVESINLNDIEYIGKCRCLKEFFGFYKERKYDFCLCSNNNYICVYKVGNKVKKFYFKPSERFIKTVRRSIVCR
ncbi:hypothetical protein [Hathewaya massiliensis]|uniref:hypothetical protein n=1 Tax=Hathewaya massiliensis TaxID=1964382 RepID=UPI001158547B|nr:hypothetical protein [Hathewaya massiliensis]